MKTTRFLIAALLMTAGCLCALAQGNIEIGDAYYIYRNDGDFNGFFYDRVQEMRFSKLDLDSVEHDQFVVQEVVTADSIYRIPLAAIDSVSFVQPEIIMNPNLYLTSEKGLDAYIYDMDETSIWVVDNTPDELMPKVGDVLVCAQRPSSCSQWGCQSMAGKVSRIARFREGYGSRIMCDEPIQDLHDVFVQFIAVEELRTDEEGKPTRRIAGRRKVEGGAEVPIINLNGNLKKDIIQDVLNVTLNYGLYLGAEVDYNITWDHFFLKTSIKRRLMAQPTLTASGKASYDQSYSLLPEGVPTPKIIFPVECPLLQFDPLPKIFFKAEGSFNASVTLPNVGISDIESFTISDNGVSHNKSMRLLCGTPTASSVAEMLSGVDGKISMEGSLYAGVMAQIGISTVDWAKKAADTYIGVDVYLGPKVSANMELSLAGALTEGSYGSMLNSSVTISPICLTAEAKATWQFLWTDPGHETFADYSKGFFEKQFFLIPSITRDKVAFNKGTGLVDADFRFDRKVLFDSKPGVEFVKRGEDTGEIVFFDRNYTTDDDSLELKQSWDIAPGFYKVRPVCDFRGTLLRAGYLENDVIVTPYIKFQKHNYTVDAPKDGQTTRLEIPFESNAASLWGGSGSGYGSLDECDIESKDSLHHTLVCQIAPTYSFRDIERLFIIEGYSENTGFVTDTIKVLVKKDLNWLHHLAFRVTGNGVDQDGNSQSGGVSCNFDRIPCSAHEDGKNLIRITGSETETTVENIKQYCGCDSDNNDCYRYGTETSTYVNSFNILLDVSDSLNYIIKEARFDYNSNFDRIFTSQNRSYVCYWVHYLDKDGYDATRDILKSDVGDSFKSTNESHATLRNVSWGDATWWQPCSLGQENIGEMVSTYKTVDHDPWSFWPWNNGWDFSKGPRPDNTYNYNWKCTEGGTLYIYVNP